jgi:hypothetical protein
LQDHLSEKSQSLSLLRKEVALIKACCPIALRGANRMAMYKNGNYLQQVQDEVFDSDHNPSLAAPRSGIYRCTGCGKEVASNQNEPLPPQNHHQHSQAQGAIRWRLIVFADHRPK